MVGGLVGCAPYSKGIRSTSAYNSLATLAPQSASLFASLSTCLYHTLTGSEFYSSWIVVMARYRWGFLGLGLAFLLQKSMMSFESPIATMAVVVADNGRVWK